MTEHIANDVYKLERPAATTSARVFGWAKAGAGGNVTPEEFAAKWSLEPPQD